MTAWAWAGVAVAGALGAVARYLLDTVIGTRTFGTFPFGTLSVNVSGSLLLGVIAGLALYHGLPTLPHTVLGDGFCGAYTTFSTMSLESVVLARQGERVSALVNVMVNALGGCGAAAAGLALAAL